MTPYRVPRRAATARQRRPRAYGATPRRRDGYQGLAAGHFAFGLSGVSLNLSNVALTGEPEYQLSTVTPTRTSPLITSALAGRTQYLLVIPHALPSALKWLVNSSPRRTTLRYA